MDKAPHKSSWKTRKKKGIDIEKKGEINVAEQELREKLEKVKKYIMLTAVITIIPVIICLIVWGPIILYMPFINVVIVIILVFFIYSPIAELLKKLSE
ncbi:MAG: hypothetical protein ACFFD2_11970 [Promethearchaeota archaeon]